MKKNGKEQSGVGVFPAPLLPKVITDGKVETSRARRMQLDKDGRYVLDMYGALLFGGKSAESNVTSSELNF